MAKALERTTVIDLLKDNSQGQKKIHGQLRQNFSGLSTTNSGVGISGAGSSIQEATGFLRTGGDTMVGPIAFFAQPVIISSGVIDIGIDSGDYSSRIIITGEGALDDDLDTILNAAFSGQLLYLQPILTTDITLKHLVDNIVTTDGNDALIKGGNIATLIFDATVAGGGNKWVLLNDGSRGGDNLGNHTATTDLLMSTHKIKFDTDHEIFGSGTSLVIGGTAAGFISLQTNSLQRMLIADTFVQLTNGAEFRANGNEIFLDADNDTKWQAGTDDVAQLSTGGGLRISVSDSSTVILNTLVPSGDIDMLGANILNLGNMLFDAGSSITEDGNGLNYDSTDGGTEGFHLFTDNFGAEKILGLNELTNEITPYMTIIPGGTTDTLDLGAPANLWHHIYMGGRLEFRGIEAQGAGDDFFRIFRDADGMTYQLGLEGATDFGRMSFVDKDNVERIEFDWNVGNRRANFNFLTEGMAIRQNASTMDAIVFYPPNNAISTFDSVIDCFRTGLAADEGLQLRRNTLLKIDITSNIAFSNITTFTPNAILAMGANLIQNTGDITASLDSTYDIGENGTRYANVYSDNFIGTTFANNLGEAINLSSTAVNIITTAGQDINFLIGGSADYQMNDTAFSVLNGHPIIMLGGDTYIQMPERVGDPAAGTTSGKFYVKTDGGVAKPYFIGDGQAAVDLSGSGGGLPHDDTDIIIQDAGDNTITLRFDLAGTTGQASVLAMAPTGGAKTWTLPDITGTLMSLSGTQTITGTKTFNSLLTINNNHLQLEGEREVRLNAAGLGAGMRYTLVTSPDKLQLNTEDAQDIEFLDNDYQDEFMIFNRAGGFVYYSAENQPTVPNFEVRKVGLTDIIMELGGNDSNDDMEPIFELHNNKTIPFNGINAGRIKFISEDSASQDEEWCSINGSAQDSVSGNEEGKFGVTVRAGVSGIDLVIEAEGIDVSTRSQAVALYGQGPVQRQFLSSDSSPTAGNTYTQTEKNMIQNMWDWLVGVGAIDES